jgi:site-specific DNA recombinase
MKAIGYARVSTEEQAREGISLDNQIAKIKAYAILNDLDLTEIILDAGKSAKNLKREGIQKIFSMIQSNQVEAVIIYKLDRMFRNTIEALETANMLDKKSVSLHSITEKLDTKSAMGRFFFTLTASLAEMERNIIAERTKDALSNKKANHERVGEIPYGYDLTPEGKLVENTLEQKVIEKVIMLRNEGLSYIKIAAHLNKQGYFSKKGGKWHQESIKRICVKAA